MNQADLSYLEKYAMSMLHIPYIWGGDNPMKGFDCSGLVIWLLSSHGVLPHKFDTTSQGLYDMFPKIKEPSLGALAFYGVAQNAISHVTLCLNNKLMIEAGGGDSKCNSKEAAQMRGACVRIKPIDYRKDLVGFVMPNY